MANAGCINAIGFDGCFLRTLQCLDSSNIGVGVQYTAPNPLDDKRFDYITYTDKCGCQCCLTDENEILIYATNGVIKNLTLTNDDVNEAIKIQWNDIFGSNRAKTIVRYKTGSYPVSITDGTLAVEETTKNQYSSTPFSLSGVLDETTYYISAFAVDSNNVVIGTQQTTITTDFGWHPSANTVAYYKFENNLNDSSGNNRNLSMSTGSFSYGTLSGGGKYVQTNTSAYSTELSIPFNQKKYTINFVLSFPTNSTGGGNGATVIELYNSSYGTSMTRFITHWTNQQTGKLYILDHSALSYGPSISNSWHHYVFTFDGTNARMYVDGQLQASTNVRANSNLSSMTFRINNVMNNSAYQYTGNNKLGRLIFENVVWSGTDISKDFNHIKNKYGIS